LIPRVAGSVAIGFVATIIITGLYAVSETHPYLDYFFVFVGNSSFGFPLSWIRTSYPVVNCSYLGLRFCPAVSSLPESSIQINWVYLGFDLLLFSAIFARLTLPFSRIAPRLNVGDEHRFSNPLNWMVIGGSALSLIWLVFYFPSSGHQPIPWNVEQVGLETSLLLFVALVGVAGGILSTWRYSLGGIMLVASGAYLLFFPPLFFTMFSLNAEYAMLYILWTSTMLVGGFLALLKGVLHWESTSS
jgi:hypothetical protein